MMFLDLLLLPQLFLLKIIKFIFTVSIWSSSCIVLVWFLFLCYGHFCFFCFYKLLWSDWSCCSPHTSSHRLGIVWVDGWNCNNCSPSLWVLWQVFSNFFHCICVPLLLSLVCQTLVLVKLSIIADWALWSSTPFAKPNTCSLVISGLSMALGRSLIISVSISLSLSPCMNCSFNFFLPLYNYILPLPA